MRLILMLAPLARALVPPGSTVAVIGSTGKLGRCAVRASSSRRATARAACSATTPPERRRASTRPTRRPPRSRRAWPSCRTSSSRRRRDRRGGVAALLEGCSAVLAVHGARRTRTLADLLPWVDHTADAAHAKRVNYEGVRNVLGGARERHRAARRARDGQGRGPWSIFSILINLLGSCAKAWNYEGEELLRAQADVDYTIVRPGVMGPPPPPGSSERRRRRRCPSRRSRTPTSRACASRASPRQTRRARRSAR